MMIGLINIVCQLIARTKDSSTADDHKCNKCFNNAPATIIVSISVLSSNKLLKSKIMIKHVCNDSKILL